MITQVTNSLYDQLITDFEVQSSLQQTSEPEALSGLRKDAFKIFKQLGLPSTKVEDWKYTNLTPFLKETFATAQDEDEPLRVNETMISQSNIQGLDAYVIVTINGKFHPELSDFIPGEDVQVLPISEAVHNSGFAAHFGKYVQLQNNHFGAMNTALFRNGLFLEIKNKAVVSKPIHLLHLYSTDDNVLLQPRHLFIIGSRAAVSVVESFVTINNAAAIFANAVSEIVIGDHAHVQHYSIQTGDEQTRHIQLTEVHQQASSVYNHHKASFPGTALLRSNLNVALDGEHIESHLYGLYLSGGHQLVDNHTVVDHRKPNCQSNEWYKGVMKEEATGVFNGKIFVRKHAQKTNAFQQNNNLMLSKKAVVDSKPQLEIFADDVKCSHGSTVGQFNEEALFYLKSRGIGEEKARALLIHAFAYDVTAKIALPAVQSHINWLIEEGLKG